MLIRMTILFSEEVQTPGPVPGTSPMVSDVPNRVAMQYQHDNDGGSLAGLKCTS